MSVKVNKLWSNKKFSNLSKDCKILYLYLCTNPQISFLGVLTPNTEVICLELKMKMDELRTASKNLIDKGYLYVGKHKEDIYFIVLDHFTTLPKSETTVLRVNKEFTSYPESFQEILRKFDIKASKKVIEFKKPSVEEVNSYAISKGYLIDGKSFIDYYEGVADRFARKDIWLDNRGKQVRDWRAKLRKVWFKEENKLTPLDGAPKGYEYFHIIVGGKMKVPDGWRNGKPFSKDFVINKKLLEAYGHKNNDSNNTSVYSS